LNYLIEFDGTWCEAGKIKYFQKFPIIGNKNMAAMGNSMVAAMTREARTTDIFADMYWRRVLNRQLYI